MRPLKLTVEGLRSIRKPVEVDFTGRDNIAIIGDTGAGKSSLLQAITYALYGRPTYSGQANQELMNDTATQLRIVLEFVVAGERFEVARTLRRAGDGRVGAGSAVLMRLADDDTVLEQLEQVRPVNERLEQLLGLDFDAFTRTVLLPQGEFAQLLVDDRPTARAAILQQIWRTDELTSLGEMARELASELAPLLARVEQQLEGEPDDPGAHLAELERRRDSAAEAAGQAGRDHVEAGQARTALKAAREHHSTATNVTEALTPGAPETHAAAAAELAKASAGITAQRNELREGLEGLRDELAQVPDERDGLGAGQIATARAQLDRLPELVTAIGEALGEQRDLQAQAGDVRGQASQALTRTAELDGQAQARTSGRAELVETNRSADTALRTATLALVDARSSAGAATAKNDEASQREGKTEVEAGEADTAQGRAEGLERPVEMLLEQLDEQRRADAAAAAAHGLHTGQDCPVCERELPELWQPPAGSGAVGQTAAALEEAKAELDAARTSAMQLRSAAEATRRSADEAREQADTLAEAAEAALVRLAGQLGVEAGALDLDAADDVLLEPLSERCRVAAEAVSTYDNATAGLEAQAAAQRATAESATTRAEELEGRSATVGRRVSTALDQLRQTLGGLPDGLVNLTVPSGPGDSEPQLPDLAPAYAALEQREQVLEQRAATRRELQDRIGELGGQLRELEEQLETAVTTPAHTLAAKLDAHRDALADASTQLRAADTAPEVSLPGLAAACTPEELPQLVEASAAATDVLLAAADALQVAATDRGKQAREVTDRLATLVELPDGREADELVRLLDERHRDLDHAARSARGAAAAFAERIDPLGELVRAKVELAKVCALVTDLAQALQPSRFPKWLTLRRSRTLLVYASKLLGEMTGERYAFADLDDEDSEWRIIDADSGTPRSPQSLSGGEQFIASLALALGIVEMMARSGGRLESLWLDEGFGALDRSNLDLAVQALASVSAGGRMVAVITHVQAVAEQVEHVLAVTRTPTGTKVDWLSAFQRLDAADGELADELSGAMASLLS